MLLNLIIDWLKETYFNKTIGNQMLITITNLGFDNEIENSLIVDQYVTTMCGTKYPLSLALFHDLGRQVMYPTITTKSMSACDTSHQLLIIMFKSTLIWEIMNRKHIYIGRQLWTANYTKLETIMNSFLWKTSWLFKIENNND